ncbi:MAG TPA: protein kinase [Micromonosporaceae bacterium]|nr:protein kinase [Micromonosporaceae bacterium]
MLVAERYRLIRSVGSGGMGRVWLARDEMLHRDVAVKQVLPPDWMTPDERDEMRARTMREARATARLSHPNVVQIYDVVHAGPTPWIVMEYIPSRSLQQVITDDGPLAPRLVAEIGLKVLAALRAAHDAGVLHRDVKPHNVLIADNGRVVLTDFGLALFDDGEGGITRAGIVMGSPQYVAPERARDGVSTVEADLWSLGATLYAAVEGKSPYARPTTLATLTALATAPPDPADRAGALKPVLDGLLRHSPRQRLTSAAVEPLLRRAAESEGSPRRALPRGRRPVAGSGEVGSAAPPEAAPGGGMAGWRRYVLLAAAVLVAASGIALAVDRWRDDGSPRGGAAAAPTPRPSAVPSPSTAASPSVTAALACTDPPTTVRTITLGPTPDGELAPLDGLTWLVDPAGFQVMAPLGWQHFRDRDVVCFRQPDGLRVLAVDAAPPRIAAAAAHWKQEERRRTEGGQLPGYQLITLGQTAWSSDPVWEYGSLVDGEQFHAVHLVLRIQSRVYLVTWRTRESEWSSSLHIFDALRGSLVPARS